MYIDIVASHLYNHTFNAREGASYPTRTAGEAPALDTGSSQEQDMGAYDKTYLAPCHTAY
jgi:hypothetical protein